MLTDDGPRHGPPTSAAIWDWNAVAEAANWAPTCSQALAAASSGPAPGPVYIWVEMTSGVIAAKLMRRPRPNPSRSCWSPRLRRRPRRCRSGSPPASGGRRPPARRPTGTAGPAGRTARPPTSRRHRRPARPPRWWVRRPRRSRRSSPRPGRAGSRRWPPGPPVRCSEKTSVLPGGGVEIVSGPRRCGPHGGGDHSGPPSPSRPSVPAGITMIVALVALSSSAVLAPTARAVVAADIGRVPALPNAEPARLDIAMLPNSRASPVAAGAAPVNELTAASVRTDGAALAQLGGTASPLTSRALPSPAVTGALGATPAVGAGVVAEMYPPASGPSTPPGCGRPLSRPATPDPFWDNPRICIAASHPIPAMAPTPIGENAPVNVEITSVGTLAAAGAASAAGAAVGTISCCSAAGTTELSCANWVGTPAPWAPAPAPTTVIACEVDGGSLNGVTAVAAEAAAA